MIKSYDPNIQGTHRIRVTFMQWDYVGHISYEIGGNCHGMSLFDGFLDGMGNEEIAGLSENDCQLSYCEEYEYFEMLMKNKSGNTMSGEYDKEELERMVVKIEIMKVIED